MVAAPALDEGIIAASVVEGSFHHDTFYAFLRCGSDPSPEPEAELEQESGRSGAGETIEGGVRGPGCTARSPTLLS